MLTLATYVAARTVNLVVEALLAPDPLPGLPSSGDGPKRLEPEASLDPTPLSKITGLAVRSGGTPSEPSREPARTALQLKLLGTLLGATASWSFAAVLDSARQKSLMVRVGDRVQGCEVVEILRDHLVLLRDGHREVVTADAPESEQVHPGESPRPSERPVGSGIRSLDENHYEASRAEMEDVLRRFEEITGQARILPAFRDGHAEGFRFFSVRPDSVYSKLGIASGDVVKRINGFELNGPENALEVLTRIKTASWIEVDLDRNGASVRKTLAIR
jgi:general secretion pathway protein C